ncbi:MAG TPA: hypothetical protein PKH07_01050 [bacterium]|nr:hypothetical protein [bacterium]
MLHFFDDAHLAEQEGLTRVPGPVEKIGPVIDPIASDGPFVASFASSLVQLDGGRWRFYYTCQPSSSSQHRLTWRLGMGVAESEDLLHWTRPNLGQVQFEGKDTNLLKIEGIPDPNNKVNYGQPQVFRLSENEWRMYFWLHGGYLRYAIAHSKDGLSWRVDDVNQAAIFHPSELQPYGFGMGCDIEAIAGKPPFEGVSAEQLRHKRRLRSNDATFVYFNEPLKRFEMYSVWLMYNPKDGPRHIAYDNAPFSLRTVHRRISENGIHWSDPELLITPDSDDPTDQQFYFLSVHWQDGWHIGMLGDYPVAAQTMDIQLCFSRDGRHWLRPARQPWIPRGPEDYDRKMICAPNRLADLGDSWLVLYTGMNFLHNEEGQLSNRKASICGAKLSKNRFLGLKTQPQGKLLTKPFILLNEKLTLDADIRGSVRAELCDPYGKALEGFAMADCVPMTGNSVQHEIAWNNGNYRQYQYESLSLRLQLDDATLYAVGL